jgi:hypothetical protein
VPWCDHVGGRSQRGKAGLHIRVVESVQILAHVGLDAQRHQTGLGRTVLGDVLGHQALHQRRPPLAQDAALAQQLAERRVLAEHPGVHGVEELFARDEVHLQRQQPEDQVAVAVRQR